MDATFLMKKDGKKVHINAAQRIVDFDVRLFSPVRYGSIDNGTHQDIAQALQQKSLYTITIIIDNLNPKYWNNKTYVKKTRREINPKYVELLYTYFEEEFGQRKANEIYSQWLNQYRDIWNRGSKSQYPSIDTYIQHKELEPRYLRNIQKRFKNVKRLQQPRFIIDRDRYYNVPEPFHHVDWRNPYDNIFIWEDDGQRYAQRGGSGGSSQRETNSKYIYAFGLVNQQQPIPSHLFYYSPNNTLEYVRSFDTLTLPWFDIGSNYHISREQEDAALRGTHFLAWSSPDILGTLTYR